MSIEEEYRHLQHSTVRRTEVTIRTEEKQGNCAGGSYRETSLRCPTTNTAVAVVAGDGAAGSGVGGGDGDEQQVI